MNLFPTSQLVLKKQNNLFELIFKNQLRWTQALELLLLSMIGLAAYGLIISLVVPDWWHAFTLLWKMIVLIWGSILLCVPSLYVFSSIRGASITIRQLLSTVLSSIATTALVVCSLAPIVGFFIWTALDLNFIRLMNGFVIGLGLLFGLVLIGRAFGFFHKQSTSQGLNEKSARDILALWFIVVCIVVVQMSLKLGPWYHLESKVCMGDMCGTPTTQPTTEVTTANP